MKETERGEEGERKRKRESERRVSNQHRSKDIRLMLVTTTMGVPPSGMVPAG